MKNLSILICAVAAALGAADAALAQVLIPPGGSQFNPPLPPPAPPPKIEPPAITQLSAPWRQSTPPAPHPSFSARISRCLDEGAASGLGPHERAAYSRSC